MISIFLGILYTLLSLIGIVLLVKTYKALRIYFFYKQKYGDQVEFLFFPLLGLFYFLLQSQKNNDDGLYFLKKICRQKPQVKAIIILSGLFDYFIAIDNDWVKFLSQDHDLFYKEDGIFAQSKLLGDSLYHSSNYGWKRQRLLLNSSFHYEALKNRVPIMKDEAKNFCSHLQPSQDFVNLDIFEEVKKLTSEILARSFFNRQFKNQILKNGRLLLQEISQIIVDCFMYRTQSIYFLLKSAFFGRIKACFILNNKAEKEILQRIDCLSEKFEENLNQSIQEVIDTGIEITKFEPKNFIEVYIKEYLIQQKNLDIVPVEDRITKSEIFQQFVLFYSAGTDTTSNLICMALYGLANNKSVYEKLQEEISKKVPQFDEFNHNNLLQLTYLDAVIKETSRLYPSAPLVIPKKIRNDYQRDDLYILKDLDTVMRTAKFSETSEFFQNIDSFIPERFINQNKIHPFDMIPFSSGPRNCIGQHMAVLEAKYILIYILQNFEIKPTPDYKLRMVQQTIYSPEDKKLILLRRK